MRGASLRKAESPPWLEELAAGVQIPGCQDETEAGHIVLNGNAVASVPVLDDIAFPGGTR